jgi:hypothetical protein
MIKQREDLKKRSLEIKEMDYAWGGEPSSHRVLKEVQETTTGN